MIVDYRTYTFLEDMIEHAQYISEFMANVSREAFEADREKQFAVIRALEVVGEGAKSIPDEVRSLAPINPLQADCRDAR